MKNKGTKLFVEISMNQSSMELQPIKKLHEEKSSVEHLRQSKCNQKYKTLAFFLIPIGPALSRILEMIEKALATARMQQFSY